MLQTSLLGLGMGVLCAAAAALKGARPIELPPAPEPRPAYLAISGEPMAQAIETYGPGCFVPTLDELCRHPHWSIRIDYMGWDSDGEHTSEQRLASLTIDAETATWRDGLLPRSLTLTGQERRDVLAAFALDCREDESRLGCGNGGRYMGVALGEDGPILTGFPESSEIKRRLEELFHAIDMRYLTGRLDDLRGLSLELALPARTGRGGRGQTLARPEPFVFRNQDSPDADLAFQVDLLDWAMTQPTSLPPGDRIATGTLRAHGTSRPIAIDLSKLAPWERTSYGVFRELLRWEESQRPPAMQ